MLADDTQILFPAFPARAEPPCMRDALRQIPGGVALVTGGAGAARFALTALSVAPLSAEPPTLIVCLDLQGSKRLPGWAGLRRFGISILAAQHRALAERFLACAAIGDDAACTGVRWLTLSGGAPLIEDAILAFDCETEEVIERHAQAIVIGRVKAMRSHDASSALVYWRGEYDRIGWTEAEIACATGLRHS